MEWTDEFQLIPGHEYEVNRDGKGFESTKTVVVEKGLTVQTEARTGRQVLRVPVRGTGSGGDGSPGRYALQIPIAPDKVGSFGSAEFIYLYKDSSQEASEGEIVSLSKV